MGNALGSALDPRPEPGDSRRHPFLAVVGITAAGYAVLAGITIGIGLLLTHALDGTVGGWDRHATAFWSHHRSSFMNSLTDRATSGVGSYLRVQHASLPAMIVAAVVIVILARRGRWREGVFLAIAFALELSVFVSTIHVAHRQRPHVFDLNTTPSNTSYPSGHTAAATVLFVGIALIVMWSTRNRLARVVAWVVAGGIVGLVGFARVYRGVHSVLDVFFGALLGLGCLAVAALAVRAASRRLARADATPEPDEPEEPYIYRATDTPSRSPSPA